MTSYVINHLETNSPWRETRVYFTKIDTSCIQNKDGTLLIAYCYAIREYREYPTVLYLFTAVKSLHSRASGHIHPVTNEILKTTPKTGSVVLKING